MLSVVNWWVLTNCKIQKSGDYSWVIYQHLTVCKPLSHSSLLLPPETLIPDKLSEVRGALNQSPKFQLSKFKMVLVGLAPVCPESHPSLSLLLPGMLVSTREKSEARLPAVANSFQTGWEAVISDNTRTVLEIYLPQAMLKEYIFF